MGKERQRRLGRRVRELREARTWTQEEVSRRAGVSPKTVSNIERGENVRPASLVNVLTTFRDDGVQALRDIGYDNWADTVAARVENEHTDRMGTLIRQLLEDPDLLERILREHT